MKLWKAYNKFLQLQPSPLLPCLAQPIKLKTLISNHSDPLPSPLVKRRKKTIVLTFSLNLSFIQSSRISSAAQLLLGLKSLERSRALAAAGRHPEPSFLRCLAVA